MLLMPPPASAAPSIRTAPSAARRRKPWANMGIAPGSGRGMPLAYAHAGACGDRFVAAKGVDTPFLPQTDPAPEHRAPQRARPPLQTAGFTPATPHRVPQARAG